jgi:8-oxo-dGTP diphosphatase
VFFDTMPVGVAAVIDDPAGRVLLVRRGGDQFGAGQWCLPCGYVEWGEDLHAAVTREVLEETGLVIEVDDVVQVAVNRHDAACPTVGIWFRARRVDSEAQPRAGDDAIAVGWFDPARLPPLAFPTDGALLAEHARRRRS